MRHFLRTALAVTPLPICMLAPSAGTLLVAATGLPNRRATSVALAHAGAIALPPVARPADVQKLSAGGAMHPPVRVHVSPRTGA